MKKFFSIVFAALFYQFTNAADTLHVITHNRQTVVTDPARGVNEYKHWGVFPSRSTAIRKIVLHVKFACPDSMRCADWDYLDFISIKRTGGLTGSSKDFEVARLLTPYGGAFTKDWKYDWEVDVTDFALLLRDSVEIEYNHSGYEPNKDRGWSVTLDFEIIKGQPIAEPVSIQKIYSGAYKYGDSASSIETELKPVNFAREQTASFAKLRISQTGHGANRGDACGEFCKKWREVFFNGQSIDKRSIWKECGDNPLYPQAGTWIYDRAAWCPGYLQIPDEYILPLQAQNTVDVNMEPYVAKPTEAVENIVAYIIQYKRPATKNDASLLAITAPTDKGAYSRTNPACSVPSIVVKNNGTATLKTLQVTYQTNSFKVRQFQWMGSLLFNQQTTIQLPGAIDAVKGANRFDVTLSKPNNKADEFALDNRMASTFTKAPVHGRQIVLALKTNNQPQQNAYALRNGDGKVVYSRRFDSTQKNLLFRDSFLLEPGCYNLLVTDSADDGLEFWANARGGRGFARLQDSAGNLLKQFESDFGSNIYYDFIVGDDKTQWADVNTEVSIGLYPTRTAGKTTLDFFSGKTDDVLVQVVTDEGNKVVEEHQYKQLREGLFTYDLSYRKPQRYYLKVFVKGELKFNKRLRVGE